MFDHIVSERIAGPAQLALYEVCSTVPEVFRYLDEERNSTLHNG